jgi:hypothetical protein
VRRISKYDRAADDVARRELGPVVVARHEAVARLVAQHAALSAQGLEIRNRGAPGTMSAVGWNCTNSMSAITAPAR